MSTIKHPGLKKATSLRKDHHVYPREGDKSFRGVWRKKKRRLAKKARATSKRMTREVRSGNKEAASSGIKQPKRLKKTGVVTLERHLDIRAREPSRRFSMFKYSSKEFTQ